MKHLEWGKNVSTFSKIVTVVTESFFFLFRMYLGFEGGSGYNKTRRFLGRALRKNWFLCLNEQMSDLPLTC